MGAGFGLQESGFGIWIYGIGCRVSGTGMGNRVTKGNPTEKGSDLEMEPLVRGLGFGNSVSGFGLENLGRVEMENHFHYSQVRNLKD